MTFKAIADEGWRFRRWHGDLAATASDTGVLDMSEPRAIIAEFIQTAALDDLDLRGALADLLELLSEPETIETFDYNGLSYDENAERAYGANGIPDAAEFYLLEQVLKSPNLDLSRRSGIAYGAVRAAWEHNLAKVQEQIPVPAGGVTASVQQAVAAYLTLGDFGSATWAKRYIELHFPNTLIDLATGNYDRSAQQFLAPDADTDNDGHWNIQEWQSVDGMAWQTACTTFVVRAFDADPDALPVPAPIRPGGSSTGGGESDCRSMGWLFVNQPSGEWSDCTVDAWVNAQEISVGQWIELSLGTEISVSAYPGPGAGFSAWDAPGTLLDDSREAQDHFPLMQPVTILGAGFSRNTMAIGNDCDLCTINVIPGPGCRVYYASGQRMVQGPDGGTVRLTAHATGIPYEGGQYPTDCFGWEMETLAPWSDAYVSDSNGTGHTVALRDRYFVYPRIWTVYPGVDDREYRRTQAIPQEEGGLIGANILEYTGSIPPPFCDVVTGYYFPQYDYDHDGHGGDLVTLGEYPSPGYRKAWLPLPTPHYAGEGGITEPIHDYIHFAKKKEYALHVTVSATEGDSDEAGYVIASTPTRYYSPDPLDMYPAGTSVEAHANPGYVFLHWDGEGDCTYNYLPATPVAGNTHNPITLAMNEDRTVTAVFQHLPPRIVEPNGDPINDNHFTFNTATPGVCEVLSYADPSRGCRFDWTLEPQVGAISMEKIQAPPYGADVKFRCTGLPADNSGFGNKTLTLIRLDDSQRVTRTVQIFFSGADGATNHPPGNDTCPHGGSSANWYYYWSQIQSVDYGDHLYCRTGDHSCTKFFQGRWMFFVDPEGNDGKVVMLSASYQQSLPAFSWESSGIDTFAWTCRHEDFHVSCFRSWYPAGYDDHTEDRDWDGDWLPDFVE